MSDQLTLDPMKFKELTERFEKGIGATDALADYVVAYRREKAAKRCMTEALDRYAAITGKQLEGDVIPKIKSNLPKLEAIAAEVKSRFAGVSSSDDPFEWDSDTMRKCLDGLLERLKENNIHV